MGRLYLTHDKPKLALSSDVNLQPRHYSLQKTSSECSFENAYLMILLTFTDARDASDPYMYVIMIPKPGLKSALQGRERKQGSFREDNEKASGAKGLRRSTSSTGEPGLAASYRL